MDKTGHGRITANKANRMLQQLQAKRERDDRLITPGSNVDSKAFQDIQALPSSRGLFDNVSSVHFDMPRLFNNPFPQLDLEFALSHDSSLTSAGKAIVKNISKYVNKLTIHGETLSTAILLNEDYILVPRHCVEGRLIDKIVLVLGDRQIKCEYIAEEDAELDYAIIKISKLPHKASVKFAREIPEQMILFHYPLDGKLVISGHFKTIENAEQARVDNVESTRHDSDSGSCGGAYINSREEIIAMHLGVDIDSEGYSMSANMGAGGADRYMLSFGRIIDKNPNSLLLHLDDQIASPLAIKILRPINRSGSWEREGYQSQLRFTQLLIANGVNITTTAAQNAAGVKMVQRNVVGFENSATVAGLKIKYPAEMAQTIDFSLGKAGLHGITSQYSIRGEVDSDHPLPWKVWEQTTNVVLHNVVVNGTGATRKGEDDMPAITIPRAIHKVLRTTGNNDPTFRNTLIAKCNANNVCGALEDIIQDYRDNNLLGITADPRYKAAWVEVLDIYEDMTIIIAAEKNHLLILL